MKAATAMLSAGQSSTPGTKRGARVLPALVSVLALGAAAGAPASHTDQAAAAPTPDAAMAAALADLGLRLLRQAAPGNAVLSPVATAAALGMLHAGTAGPAEREIEALFGPRPAGAPPFKQRLPPLLQQLGGGSGQPGAGPSPFVMAGRVWIDSAVAPAVPAPFTQRLATRYGADALRLSFADAEAARGQINAWTADHTRGRIAELLPAGSVSAQTQLTITSAIHFRSVWAKPFDPALTEARPFQSSATPSGRAAGAAAAASAAAAGVVSTPTMLDERVVRQARVAEALVLELPFAGNAYTLLLAVPQGNDGSTDALLQRLSGSALAQMRAALQPQKCQLALPKFAIAPQAVSLKPALQQLGMKTAFETTADLRPMLGHAARGVQVGDLVQAAGITIDEQGGEAVAAAAVTVQAKSLAMPAPLPPCAVDRPFVFAVVHQASGVPLFLGRVTEPRPTP